MSYTKQTWNAGVVGGTPISAAALNYIESGIETTAKLGQDFMTKAQRLALSTAGLLAGYNVYETDTGRTYRWTGSSGFWRFESGVGPTAVMYLNASNGSIPSITWTPFGFDAATYDPWVCFTAAANSSGQGGLYTCPVKGIYRFSAVLSYQPNATGSRLVKWQTRVNSSSAWQEIFSSAASISASNGINSIVAGPPTILELVAGQQLRVMAYQNCGATLGVVGAGTGPEQGCGAIVELTTQTGA